MGLILQIMGVLVSILSLMYSITAIINGTPKTIAFVLLIIGGSMVRIGRDIHKNSKRP